MNPVFLSSGAAATDLTSTFSTAVGGANDQTMKYIAIALPVALGIIIAIFAIKKGISFFKSMANKG